MPTGNTSLLGLALPVQGELDGTWGDVVNDSITSLVDSAIAGTTTLGTDADVTLTTTALASNQARQAILLWTASNGATTRNITAPAQSKPYIVINAGTGSIVLRGAGPTTGVTIVSGEKCLAAWNGSDFVKIATSNTSVGDVVGPASATDGNLAAFDGTTGKLIKQAATVTVAQGGTSLSTLTANNVILGNGASAPLFVAPGTNGNVLTSNGTTWVSTVPPTGVGLGGTTATGNVTLTSSSAAALTITPANPGLYVTLPNATTCIKADNLFSIYNAGEYDYGVKNSAGTKLGWVRARTGAMIGLSDNSTAAGIWVYYGLQKTAVTASYRTASATASTSLYLDKVVIDSSRTCFLYGSSSNCYAIVYDESTYTWGSPTLVRASGAFTAVLSATNQILVVSATTTAMEAVTLTISGTSVTVENGTKATATLAGSIADMGMLIAVGSSFVVSYGRSSNVSGIRAITISGTTPTIGAESALSAADDVAGRLYASGSIVRTVSNTGALLYAKPYTVSGTTLTAGTEATTATTSVTAPRTFLNGNGNIVAIYTNTTVTAAIIKLTGTTEAISAVSVISTGALPETDFAIVSSSKTFIASYSGGAFYANILTDTSGTASVGTQVTNSNTAYASPGNITDFWVNANSGSTVRIAYNSPSVYAQITFDCSGASATISSGIMKFLSVSTMAVSLPKNNFGDRQPMTLLSGSSSYTISFTVGDVFDVLMTPNSIIQILPASLSQTFLSSIYGFPGETDSESWFLGGSSTAANAGLYQINKVEVAE